ncbi:MAG TPA: type VI secretion system tube protein TssD [Symbiobacteriaceae bacterium]|jgi:type VI secretion system secreted protein Hcp|nr:type VI secretion system tube protein TssD [Symbiobacteriaceae bacterium]
MMIRRWLSVGLAVVVAIGLMGLLGRPVTAPGPATVYAAGVPMADQTMMLSIEGTRQGKFKGESRDGSIPTLGYKHEVISPRDAQSGLPTGKRQHTPLVITKRIDRSSPLLMQALVTNEVLKNVTLRFVDARGATAYSITLQNASVAGIQQQSQSGEAVEEISFTYQKITWTWTDGGITAMDDWEARQ